MWWKLLIVLVATAAASAEENEEDRPNCMSVHHHECEDEYEKQVGGVPGNDEELEEFCKYSVKFFNCSDRVFSSCDGEYSGYGRYLEDLGAVTRRVCNEDPILRTTVAAILPCFKENLEEIKACDDGFDLVEEAFSDAVNKSGITITGDSRSRTCLFLLYGVGCTVATTGQLCGDAAKNIVLNLLLELDVPFEACPSGVKEKIPEIIEVIQQEAKNAKPVENTEEEMIR